MKSLRKEFILSSFLTVAGILTLLLGTLNAFDFAHATVQSEEALNTLVDNGGHSTEGEMGPEGPDGKERDRVAAVRYFTYALDSEGNVETIDHRMFFFWRGRSGGLGH